MTRKHHIGKVQIEFEERIDARATGHNHGMKRYRGTAYITESGFVELDRWDVYIPMSRISKMCEKEDVVSWGDESEQDNDSTEFTDQNNSFGLE